MSEDFKWDKGDHGHQGNALFGIAVGLVLSAAFVTVLYFIIKYA